MKTKLFLLCFASAATSLAADPPSQFNSLLAPMPLTETMRLQNFLTAKPNIPVIPLGKSDFVLSGPLVEGFRHLPPADNLSRGQRFLRLPVVRLFVPKPMPWPEGGGKYFAWRNSDNPWTLASSRPGIQKGPQ